MFAVPLIGSHAHLTGVGLNVLQPPSAVPRRHVITSFTWGNSQILAVFLELPVCCRPQACRSAVPGSLQNHVPPVVSHHLQRSMVLNGSGLHASIKHCRAGGGLAFTSEQKPCGISELVLFALSAWCCLRLFLNFQDVPVWMRAF